MGTHPIFESDFDCLTDADLARTHSRRGEWLVWRSRVSRLPRLSTSLSRSLSRFHPARLAAASRGHYAFLLNAVFEPVAMSVAVPGRLYKSIERAAITPDQVLWQVAVCSIIRVLRVRFFPLLPCQC